MNPHDTMILKFVLGLIIGTGNLWFWHTEDKPPFAMFLSGFFYSWAFWAVLGS